MRQHAKLVLLMVVVPGLAGAGCEAGVPTVPETAIAPELARQILEPELPAPGDFVDPATDPNPYFPLVPGTTWTYEAETEDGLERTVDVVTDETRTILGIDATVVIDSVFLEDELVELTYDWYGQDAWGNVWYLGEESCEFEEGDDECDPAGSWEAGVDGAVAGILMWAEPLDHKGVKYRQEFYEGEAEDMAKVLHGGLTVSVPAGDFDGCIETMDFTPLEPGAREHKFYCPGIGLVLEVQPMEGRIRNELVEVLLP